MGITEKQLDQAYVDYQSKFGGVKQDYFALLYVAKEFQREIDDVAHQVAFGGNDYGLDAFYVDKERRNLYLFQFKWSKDHKLFKDSFNRLIAAGMERVFGNPLQDQKQNQLLLQLKSALHENEAVIDRVIIQFIFNGDPSEAEQSAVLDSLREDLESKKYLIDHFFKGREVSLTFQFVSNQTKKLAGVSHPRKTFEYKIPMEPPMSRVTSSGETLHVGFLRLTDLYRMFQDMGQRFFERNIRAGLSAERPPNRAIRQSLAKIVLKEQEAPDVFAFNHNGVALAAERFKFDEGIATLTEPRLLNGAQTITSFAKFMQDNDGHPSLKNNSNSLDSISVLSKIITASTNDFIVNVTICNNRQNPVEPWNLRASDPTQLEFQDKFRQELGVYYERQENAFQSLSDEDLDDMGIQQYKAIEIRHLAQTFLATQGEIDKMSRMPDVFESEPIYKNTFKDSYLRADSTKILLAYKIRYRLGRIIWEIVDKGVNKYSYISHARNLVWALLIQGLLNDSNLRNYSERFGTGLSMEADYTEILRNLASTRIRFIISDAVEDDRYQQMIDEEKYSFLRTKAMFERCMDVAYKKYKWKKQSV
jgi:hypothetical protein